MKRKISYEEIEKDLAELNKALKTIKKKAAVEKALSNIIENVKFQATELRKREEELKKSQEYTRSLFYSIPNPTSILDLDGRRIDTAKATEDYFRMSRDKILGAKAEDLYEKEDLKKIRETMEKGKKGYSSCEATCIRGDGTRFPVILSFAPVRDKDGNLINIAFSATDITELRKREQEQANAISALSKVLGITATGDLSARVDTKGWSEELEVIGMAINSLIESLEYNIEEVKKSKAKLEESNRFNQMLIENLPVAIWMANEEGKCCLVNKELTRLLGWKKEELIGKLSPESPYVCKSGLPYMKEGTVEALSKIWKHTLEKKELAADIVPFKTKDGRIVIHRGVEIPYGKEKARLWTSMDVTDLKKGKEGLGKSKTNT
jgi:PAS domain S-box-containing protein